MSQRTSVVITVDDAHLPSIKQVADQLRSRGMEVESVLESTGIITGSCPTDVAPLHEVPGVASVEPQGEFQLPPPDSPVQ